MFAAIRHFWRTGERLQPAGMTGSAANLVIDAFDAETYDGFDEASILADPQAIAEAISPKRVRLEVARNRAIDVLASDDGLLGGKVFRPTMQMSVPGSLMSAINKALRESEHHRRSSVIAWADVIQKSRRIGIPRTSLIDLRIRGEKTLLQQLIATKDYCAFIPIATPLPDGTYANGKIMINGDYFGEAVDLVPNGLGALFNESSFYVGDVRDGAMHGAGDQYFQGQPRYSGNFHRGFRHGRGLYTFSCGPSISALFVEDLPEGEGCFTQGGSKETVFFLKRGKTSSFSATCGGRYEVLLHSDGELSLSKASEYSSKPAVSAGKNLNFRKKLVSVTS